ncbi:MAG TPA: DNA-formamidopyrimidine glycosylase family protein [Thermoanaerobaculia bacterium]|nr:DNA-formamidopyrimidine glycosylase family protein [Thermoanaerobaculia bacterium]
MPEGDTIHRAARTLHAALAGRVITRFETVFPQLARIDEDAPLAGRTVDSVEAAGKNLLMHFSGDLHLRTHMRMHGSWHIYKPGERWRRGRDDMRILLETDTWVAVGFNVPVAEFYDHRQEDLRKIGPDLIGKEFDFDEAKRRIRERADTEIADALLNQRVVAGIGNEYKSELLFIAKVNPFTKVRDVSDEQLDHILKIARRIMVANVEKRSSARVTTFSLDARQNQYVFSRGNKPCRRCGTPIAYAKQGRDVRGTYWCPKCQALQ